jgi:putative SOS response-associated peptidase YedK
MCGRYARKSDKQKIAEAFHVAVDGVPDFAWSFNAAPQSFQPVVRLNAETGEREIAILRWGLIPFWSKDAKIGLSTINAKAETVATSPVFREAFKRRRCLVPADAFYEWQKLDAKNKQPYAIAMKSGEPYGFAGIWERWKQPDGEKLETFSIITTDANSLVEPFHDRMPVILEPKDYQRWLDCSDKEKLPLDLLRAFPAELMTAWPVSRDVGNVRNDRPELMERVEGAGGGSLFAG